MEKKKILLDYVVKAFGGEAFKKLIQKVDFEGNWVNILLSIEGKKKINLIRVSSFEELNSFNVKFLHFDRATTIHYPKETFMGLHKSYLYKIFKDVTGIKVKED